MLIVEDDKGIGTLLYRLLSKDHAVTLLADGRAAADQFVAGQYDVTMIDLGLPGLPGDQLAARLRELDPSLATVLMTGWTLAADDERLSPFDLQMSKPFGDLKDVTAIVAQALALHDVRAASSAGS